jgi:uncharacterized coiled-coil DUF342 family protein
VRTELNEFEKHIDALQDEIDSLHEKLDELKIHLAVISGERDRLTKLLKEKNEDSKG